MAIIIIVAVSVGVAVGRKNNHVNTANPPSNSNSSTGVTNPDAVNQTDPNDPSTFVKDPNLHQAFYGIAYTPVGSQLPNCGNKLGRFIRGIPNFWLTLTIPKRTLFRISRYGLCATVQRKDD